MNEKVSVFKNSLQYPYFYHFFTSWQERTRCGWPVGASALGRQTCEGSSNSEGLEF